jgi:BirA family biotin operon repressor/biotin-[acetyl-CoA-carboxylase] ligase
VALDVVDSTNDEARKLADEGAEDGTLVWAREQRKGRGRRGREWHSPRGNLYLSLVLRPECPPWEAAQLSFVAGLGIVGALSSVALPLSEITLKWPNDVLLNGRKVAGILLESATTGHDRLDWLVVGVGVNLTAAPDDTEFPATSLRAEQCIVDERVVLEAFGRHFLSWVNRWLDDGFAPVRKEWLRRAAGVGEDITVNLERESLAGTFVDIDDTGALVLELDGGEGRTIAAGDVYFGRGK